MSQYSTFFGSEVSKEECKKGVEMPLVVLGRWFNTTILGKLFGPLGGSLNAK